MSFPYVRMVSHRIAIGTFHFISFCVAATQCKHQILKQNQPRTAPTTSLWTREKENSLQNDKAIIYFVQRQRIGKSHLDVVAFYPPPSLLMCSTFVLDNQQIKIKLIGFNYI